MPQIEPNNRDRPDLSQARRLLEQSARSLRLGLELWASHDLLLGSRSGPKLCADCRRETPEEARECQRRRCGQAETSGLRSSPIQWICPHGAELTAWPLGGSNEAGATLVCRGRRGNGNRGAQTRSVPLHPDAPSLIGPDGRAGVRWPERLGPLARILGEELRTAREIYDLRTQLAAKQDELKAFYAMAGQVSGSRDPAPDLRVVMEKARAAEEADAVLLWTSERRHRELVLRPGLRLPEEEGRRLWNVLGPAVQARLQQSGSGSYSGSLSGVGASLPATCPPLEVLAVRVRDGEDDGALCLVRLDPPRAFQAADALLVGSLAEQIRLALSNAELYEDLRLFLMGTVKSLVGAIEEKDPYTSGHSERVHLVSLLIGKELGLGSHELETLRWASILHDVGKIGMPEGILLKPGRLTEEEFRVIREHPDRGYRLLRPIRQLSEAAACIRAHHEQVDGSGYPQGLRGEKIPLLSRIIAVADTFDALTSTRAYRTARTLDYALEEIIRVRGQQLDCRVVDGFLRMEPFLREHQIMIEGSRGEQRREAA